MAIDFPNSPTTGQIYATAGKTWQWTGALWDMISSSAAVPDIRGRWNRSSVAYPGTNANIDFDSVAFATPGAPTESAGEFTVQTAGLYDISFAATWGQSSNPAVIATWLSVTNAEGTVRYMTDQVILGTTSENGWITSGSVTLRLRVGDTFRVQVFSPSAAPAGILGAEITVAMTAGMAIAPFPAPQLHYHASAGGTVPPPNNTTIMTLTVPAYQAGRFMLVTWSARLTQTTAGAFDIGYVTPSDTALHQAGAGVVSQGNVFTHTRPWVTNGSPQTFTMTVLAWGGQAVAYHNVSSIAALVI